MYKAKIKHEFDENHLKNEIKWKQLSLQLTETK